MSENANIDNLYGHISVPLGVGIGTPNHCAGGKIHSRRNLTATGPASFLSINILYHDHGLLHAENFRLKFDRITLSMLLL